MAFRTPYLIYIICIEILLLSVHTEPAYVKEHQLQIQTSRSSRYRKTTENSGCMHPYTTARQSTELCGNMHEHTVHSMKLTRNEAVIHVHVDNLEPIEIRNQIQSKHS